MCAALRAVGLREVELPVDLTEETFCRDPLCPDTLVFSRQLHSSLTGTEALNAQVLHEHACAHQRQTLLHFTL